MRLPLSRGLMSARGTTVLLLIVLGADVDAQTSACTTAPDIKREWRAAAIGQGTDAALDQQLASARARLSTMRDPLSPLYSMSEAELRARQEYRVWKDTALMVVADRFAIGELLVVPRDSMAFPSDASDELLAHIARASAKAAEALRAASGKSCPGSAAVRIYVNPPNAIGVRQLHVHVQPSWSGLVGQLDAYWADVTARMSELMKQP